MKEICSIQLMSFYLNVNTCHWLHDKICAKTQKHSQSEGGLVIHLLLQFVTKGNFSPISNTDFYIIKKRIPIYGIMTVTTSIGDHNIQNPTLSMKNRK